LLRFFPRLSGGMRSDSAGFRTSRSCWTAKRSALESTSQILSRDSCESGWFAVLVVGFENGAITCRNTSPPKSYWTNASGGLKVAKSRGRALRSSCSGNERLTVPRLSSKDLLWRTMPENCHRHLML